ncbi:sterol desaturase family protein [Colwellia sp. Bg11-12]|uniref:sterol desaturase family protein n=1 Tax=Colwellia sp. Bg11-12 TaxID=2759817 RepID=UPI0015F63A2C|nr:sterol desaturase family protein [Colwellia sp. Bg11-12]MBA6262813.1 sterol desaturase family protein [Colwellia sp. Bg11-12]
MTNEIWWRLGCFFSVLTIMLLLEWQKPARKSPIKKTKRWLANFGLVFASSVLARLTIPIGLTAIALYNVEQHIGMFNQDFYTDVNVPSWLTIVLSLLLLDVLIYWQHRLFHQVPMLWRLHRVHHADAHVDTSTGLRFHPIEIVLSILIKLAVVVALGIPAIAVLIFEIALNGLALFNHANIRLPRVIEKPLRLILMTQILHRIHHSQVVKETNSNYGFSVIWWDKLFGSYKGEASKHDGNIKIGLVEYPLEKQNSSLWALLVMPFKSK